MFQHKNRDSNDRLLDTTRSPIQSNFPIGLDLPVHDSRKAAVAEIRNIYKDTPVMAYGKKDRQYLAVGISTRVVAKKHEIRIEREKQKPEIIPIDQDCLSTDLLDRVLTRIRQEDQSPLFGYVGFDFISKQASHSEFPAAYFFSPKVLTRLEYDHPLPDVFETSNPNKTALDLVNTDDLTIYLDKVEKTLGWIKRDPERNRRATVAHKFKLLAEFEELYELFASDIASSGYYRSFYLRLGNGSEFVGHSPELLAYSLKPGNLLSYKLSGTLGNSSGVEDISIFSDPKVLAEHNASISGYSKQLSSLGEVKTAPSEALHLRGITHLAARIETTLYKENSDLRAMLTALPAGVAPRESGLEWLGKVERSPRGPYYGLVGMIHQDGSVDFTQVLRTIFQTRKDAAYLFAGANISSATLDYWKAQEEVEEVKRKISTIQLPSYSYDSPEVRMRRTLFQAEHAGHGF